MTTYPTTHRRPLRVAATAHRVRLNTAPEYNRRIRESTKANILYFSEHPDLIDDRLQELDEEWDVERVLQAHAAALTAAGSFFALWYGRRYFVLPLLVGGLLLNHALHGWCPPLPLLRSLGVRTAQEIEAERYALKALRGDFRNIGARDTGDAAAATERL